MSRHTLNESYLESQVVLRLQYESKLKDDAILKATKIISELQEELDLYKVDKDALKKDLTKKSAEITDFQNRYKESQSKITFLQECLKQKDKQLQQLEERLNIKKTGVEKRFNNYLTISYDSKKDYKQEGLARKDYLNQSDYISRTPIRSTAKKSGLRVNTQESQKMYCLSKEVGDLRRDLDVKDRQNLYLLKKNKAIEDYLSIIDDVNHPMLRRQMSNISRGLLL